MSRIVESGSSESVFAPVRSSGREPSRPGTAPSRRWRLGLCPVILISACVACSEGPPARRRGLLIGIDGATLRVIEPLMSKGRLPVLQGIAQAGVHGPLRSELPLHSPRLWNTIATGKSPKKHGITSFAGRERRTGKRRLLLSVDRRIPALWNIVSDAGLSVGVVNWWNTYPPERINGVMVSDHALPGASQGMQDLTGAEPPPEGALVFPASWRKRVLALVRDPHILTDIKDPFHDNHALPRWFKGSKQRDKLSRNFRQDSALANIALTVQKGLDPDLLMVLLPGIDRVSHHLWGNLEPEEEYPANLRPTQDERVAGTAALYRYYEYTDELIGLLTASYGRHDLVMVLSDHGFEAWVSMGLLTGNHQTKAARDGILFARGFGIAPGSSSQGMSIYDVTPTVLAWMGLPLAADMPGQPGSFLNVSATATVDTFDHMRVERLPMARSGAEDVIMEQLRALGYVE